MRDPYPIFFGLFFRPFNRPYLYTVPSPSPLLPPYRQVLTHSSSTPSPSVISVDSPWSIGSPHRSSCMTPFVHALLGLYVWEWFTSLDFDWAFLSGKRRLRWPLIFYFVGRYSLLAALVGITVSQNVTTEVNCQSLYTFNQVAGNFSIAMASVNLSLRTMAIWSQKLYIVLPLGAIILGHWGLLLRGVVLVKATWVEGTGCLITDTSNTIILATFIYTMSFDFIVTILTAYKLAYKKGTRSQLVSMIFTDGLVYFVIAFLGGSHRFLANTIAVVFMGLNLNAVMSVIADVPSAVVSTIVACRVVRRLTNYNSKGAEMFTCVPLPFRLLSHLTLTLTLPCWTSPSQGSNLEFRSGQRPGGITVNKSQAQGVHVQVRLFSSHSLVLQLPLTRRRPGQAVKDADSDIEAQGIRDEFKHPPY
ncbi:hypothetical protein EW146_g1796 [Bondarzewia mesenterica]|uniref:Uncharacterized protein n=1 Tax=Bondarzewia mesenterica TaxID=1095465 RepID=A0A4S4M8W4_9AGAM|nr:hypothetical protein EW146_g1796 [Bondarzewia mesenterica]